MERSAQRDLEILTELARGEPVTQRGLARKLGIALGLANLYVKRLVRKGYIKVTTIPSKRLRYLLTPQGIAAKTRLTCEYMDYSLQLYRQTRHVLRETLLPLVREAQPRVAIYGTAEAAELAFLTLRELGLDVATVIADEAARRTFLGIPVQDLADITPEGQDLVIVATFASADGAVAALTARGVRPDQILALRPRR